jgi:hypothetical protein
MLYSACDKNQQQKFLASSRVSRSLGCERNASSERRLHGVRTAGGIEQFKPVLSLTESGPGCCPEGGLLCVFTSKCFQGFQGFQPERTTGLSCVNPASPGLALHGTC